MVSSIGTLSNFLIHGILILSIGSWCVHGQEQPPAAEQAVCPPEGLDALVSLDIEAFVDGPWYALRQIPVLYQPASDLFCVRADYTRQRQIRPFYCVLPFLPARLCPEETDQSISILNTSRSQGVDGRSIVANLGGSQRGAEVGTGRLRVGLVFLPESLWGNYFVMAAGTYEELMELDVATLANGDNPSIDPSTGNTKYEWSIISSGLPEVATANGCLPGDGPFNFDGFWFFSRDPLAPPEVAARIEEVAAFQGFDTSAQLPVVNAGCDFEVF